MLGAFGVIRDRGRERTEVRSQMSEVGKRQRSEDGKEQKSDVRCQRSEMKE